MIARNDGTIECWQQPELAAWEVPKRKRRPRAPEWKPAWEIAELVAQRGDTAATDVA